MSQHLKSVNLWHKLAILSLAFGFFLVGVNRLPVPTVDGAVRAAMARNVVRDGLLYPITYEGRVFTDHPPLYVWLTALSYKVFGINDFAFNLVPHFFAFLTVVVTALTALEVGLGGAVALAATLVLCLTRDFVLSSVRGYIEPLLEFFVYSALLATLYQKRKRALWPAALAGVSVWLAAYSKGPVALWPFLFCLFLFVWNGQTVRRRTQLCALYLGAFAACTLVWALWVSARGDWHYWHDYLYKQVLSSALEGRGGAQSREPLYFFKILAQYYWPWLPLLLWSIYRSIRGVLSLELSSNLSYSWIFMVTGLGFVAGFSAMTWKFWYYIAPAYPAFALLIATALHDKHERWLSRPAFARRTFYVAAAWILIASVFPITLHRERVPEVLAFRDTIVNSNVTGPVWYVRDPMDHNMIGTSGQWYFDRVVARIDEPQEPEWFKSKLTAPAWIITGADYFKTCQELWCKKSKLIQSAGKSSLVYYGI